MARKVIGPTGSRRRRWLFLCTSFTAIALAVIFIPSAFAVHDAGVFELDGNAQTAVNSTPGIWTSSSQDADTICNAFKHSFTDGSGNPTNPAGPTCNQPGAIAPDTGTAPTRSAFVTDASGNFPSGLANDDQWTSGSKDDQEISAWRYKDAASSNDKSDIENAFAAVYTGAAGTPEAGHKLIYFGGDRTSNSGSENTAFWFLQNPVAEVPNGTGVNAGICTLNSGCPFSSSHVAAVPGTDNCLTPQGQTSGLTMSGPNAGKSCTESTTDSTCPVLSQPCATSLDPGGDILVVSAFTIGGTQPSIAAYEWVGVGNAPNKNGASCVTSKCSVIQILAPSPGCTNTTNAGDSGCAITNQNDSSITGNPGPGNTEPIPSPWIYVEKSSDNATSGAGTCTVTANKMCPGIYLEGGLDLTALGLGGECTSSFTMDTRSSASVDASLQDLAGGTLGSCTTSLTTQAGDTAATGGVASPTSIGGGSTTNAGTDTATLTVHGSASWSGTLSWFICGPFTSTPSANPKCDLNKGVAAGSTAVSGTDENAHTYASPVASSPSLSSAGIYCWTAHFQSGTSGVPNADDTGTASECFTVSPVTPALETCAGSYTGTGTPPACAPPASDVIFGNPIHDTARLSNLAKEPGSNGGRTSSPDGTSCTALAPCYPTIGATNGAYAGTITFTLFGPADTGCGSQTTGGTGVGDANPQSTPSTGTGSVASTGNGTYGPVSYTPANPGKYHWKASYANASAVNNSPLPVNHNASCDDSNEDVTVAKIPTSITTGPFVYPNDSATITSSGGASDTFASGATTSFRLFKADGGNTAQFNCLHDDGTGTSTGLLYSETATSGSALHSWSPHTTNYPNTTGNVSVNPTAAATYYWNVTFTPASGDTAHIGSSSTCVENTTVTVTNDP